MSTEVVGLRFRHADFHGEFVDAVRMEEARAQDIAALQRETGWRLGKLSEMAELEMVGAAIMVYLTWRSRGRMVSLERATKLLDELTDDDVQLIEADVEDDDVDPRQAPTGSGRGDDEPEAA